MFICVWGCHVYARVSKDPLEMELQIVRSHLTWVPGTELRSPIRAVHALNH